MNIFDKNIERPNIIKGLSDESIRRAIFNKLSDSNIDEVRKIDYEIFLQLFEYIFNLEKHIELSDHLIGRLTRETDVVKFLKEIKGKDENK